MRLGIGRIGIATSEAWDWKGRDCKKARSRCVWKRMRMTLLSERMRIEDWLGVLTRSTLWKRSADCFQLTQTSGLRIGRLTPTI